MPDKVCPSCKVAQDEAMFEVSASPDAMNYPDLGLLDICRTCQLKHKECTNCHIVKPAVDTFWHKKERGLYGYHSWCRECLNTRNRENHRGRRRDADNARMRERYHATKGE